MTEKAYSREVVATMPGYYGVYRQKDEKFVITAPEHFSERWMADAKSAAKAAESTPSEDPVASELREALGLEGELQALRQREAKLQAELDAARAANASKEETHVEEDDETAGKEEVIPEEKPATATRRRRALAS